MNDVVSNILAIDAVDLLEVMDIHRHSLIGPVRAAVKQHGSMVEECLPGIETSLPIKFDGAEHGRRLPHFDEIANPALNAPQVVGLYNEIHGPELQAAGLILRLIAAGGYDHRNGSQQRIFLGSGQKLEAVAFGHIHIQDNQGQAAVVLRQNGNALFAIPGAEHIIIL